MDKNLPITIERVANGFIVRRELQDRIHGPNYTVPIVNDETYVFETFGNLTSWLNFHFPDEELDEE